jgi:hypothetical protein
MRFPPLEEVLRDGVWTEVGPRAVIGEVGQNPTLLAVVDEHGEQVRVVHESMEARVAGWLPIDQLHLTVRVPVALAGTAESRPRADRAAVLLLPGIPVAELGRDGDRVEIAAADGEMRAQGWIDADLLGRIWVAEPFPDDPDGTHTLASGAPIHLAPRADATVVATALEDARAVVLRELAGWMEIRIVGSWMNVHGYVEEYRLYEGGAYGGLFGRAATRDDWPDVPAGACLVESVGDPPVGVTLVPLNDQEPVPGGAKVEVDAPWGTMSLVAEQTDDGGWRTCPISAP